MEFTVTETVVDGEDCLVFTNAAGYTATVKVADIEPDDDLEAAVRLAFDAAVPLIIDDEVEEFAAELREDEGPCFDP